MKKIAITLTLVSGLYLTGTTKAEGLAKDTAKPDSCKLMSTEMCALEAVGTEASMAAEALLRTPLSPQSLQDEQTSKAFLMEMTSLDAAKAAEEIRSGVEE